jgi:hypothetical protein
MIHPDRKGAISDMRCRKVCHQGSKIFDGYVQAWELFNHYFGVAIYINTYIPYIYIYIYIALDTIRMDRLHKVSQDLTSLDVAGLMRVGLGFTGGREDCRP